jgi:hypothetical protein
VCEYFTQSIKGAMTGLKDTAGISDPFSFDEEM